MEQQARRKERNDPQAHTYYYEGHPVELLDTFSRGRKRIALIEDRDGEIFEVFYEQLS